MIATPAIRVVIIATVALRGDDELRSGVLPETIYPTVGSPTQNFKLKKYQNILVLNDVE